MPWAPHPELVPGNLAASLVTNALDPVLVPLGFAPGQAGVTGEQCQVIFCRGELDSDGNGCVDLVVDLGALPDWRILDVRYWGFPPDRWHLDFDRGADLRDQLSGLALSLRGALA